MSVVNRPVIKEIVWLNFEEAAFLWSQREAAAQAVNYSLQDLAELDERLEGHIAGLRVSDDHGWAVCESELDHDDPGTLFTAAIIALESGNKDRIAKIVEVSNASREAFEAVVSAFGWMETGRFNRIITSLVSANSRRYRRLGIAACGERRINPRAYLDQAINSSDLFLKALALKVAGELKRVDLLPLVRTHLEHEDDTCRFEAARSACILGDLSALTPLSAFALSQSAFTLPAMQVVLRLVDAQTARNWLKAISKKPEQVREMLTGIGFTGDPVYVPMLIKQMEQPELARLSGGSFSLITGVDLSLENLVAGPPDGFDAGPDDDPDNENVEMDIDEDLPWPDAAMVMAWWEQNKSMFVAGTRYLAGQPISPAHCSHILKNGMQNQRSAAALELALSRPDVQWFNTTAPGARQIMYFNSQR